MKNKLLTKKSPIKFEKLLYILFTVVLVTALSCSKNEDGINNETISEADLVSSKGIENAPSESGAFVIRDQYSGELALTLVDERSNLTVTIGYPDLLPRFCGGGSPDDILTWQDIIAANHGERVVSLAQGEAQAYVFEGTPDLQDFSTWCPFFENALILAEGNAMAISPITDTWLADTNNTANNILVINGELLSPTNEVKHFTARVLFSYDKEEEFNTLLDILVSVTVQLH